MGVWEMKRGMKMFEGFYMRGRTTGAFLMLFAVMFCVLATASEAQAASRLSYSVTRYHSFKGSDGIWRIQVDIKVTNNSKDERVITRLYDASFDITADIKSLDSGKTYKMKHHPYFPSISDNIDLWPGKSRTFELSVRYDRFQGKGWKWEGEEKTRKPSLINFKTSNISMKYETRIP
jgi:hypothetical protein